MKERIVFREDASGDRMKWRRMVIAALDSLGSSKNIFMRGIRSFVFRGLPYFLKFSFTEMT